MEVGLKGGGERGRGRKRESKASSTYSGLYRGM